MEAKGGSGAGRPKNFDGSEQAVLNIFTQHLGPHLRTYKKLNNHKLFVDLSRCKDKNKAARPFVQLMHAMGKLNSNFRFGGRFNFKCCCSGIANPISIQLTSLDHGRRRRWASCG